MKNPNGFGCVCKQSGNRRKPYAARITTGWNEEGKQQYKNIGYYETRSEAMIALAEFNKNPYSLDANHMTFAEVYEKWSREKFPKISHSNMISYTASYKTASILHDMKFIDIRKVHLQKVIDDCENGWSSLKRIKVLFNQLYKFALENDIITKDYSKFVELPKETKQYERKPFTQEEIDFCWENIDRMEFIDTVLIMIYSGLRIGELLTIETVNVDIENRTMKGGLKTEAGKDRIIPINKKILPLIKARIDQNNKYLIVNYANKQMQYSNYYREKWEPIMGELEFEHKPHDCRHTFATLMDNAGANKLSIKRIMGHASQDITDKVYTHKDIEELKKAIDLI